LGTFGIFCLAHTQEPPPTTPPGARPAQAALSPELNKLDWLIGSWSGDMAWTAPGMEGNGKYTTRISRDGHFLKLESSMASDSGTYTETSYLSYDPVSKKYVMYNFTNASPVPRIQRGDMTSDSVFVSTSDPWDMGTGTPMTARSTVTMKTKDEVHYLVEFNLNGQWTKAGEVTLKKEG